MIDTDGKSQTQGPWANEAEAISVFEKVRLFGRLSVISADVAGRAEIQRQASIVSLVSCLTSRGSTGKTKIAWKDRKTELPVAGK